MQPPALDMAGWRRLALVCVVAIATSCGGPVSARRLKSTAETGASWAAAVRWAVQAWGERRVTGAYLRATLTEARRSLLQESGGVRGRRPAPGVDLQRAARALDRVAAIVDALQADVDKADDAAAQAHALELSPVERELRSLAASLGP